MKIPLIARIPESAIHRLFEASLKIPNKKFFNRIGYFQPSGGTYLVYHYNSIFSIFKVLGIHLWVNKKYQQMMDKINKMKDTELENLVKNYKSDLPNEMTYGFSLVKYDGTIDSYYYFYYEYGIIVKW